MEFIAQNLDDIVASLQPLTVEWKDDVALRVIARLQSFPTKTSYNTADLQALLDENFNDGVLILRLFLGFSKDHFVSVMRGVLGDAGIGVKSYRANPDVFVEGLLGTGILEAMAAEITRK